MAAEENAMVNKVIREFEMCVCGGGRGREMKNTIIIELGGFFLNCSETTD